MPRKKITRKTYPGERMYKSDLHEKKRRHRLVATPEFVAERRGGSFHAKVASLPGNHLWEVELFRKAENFPPFPPLTAFDRLSGTFIYRNWRVGKKGVFAKRSHPGNWHNRRQQRELNEK
jgi:hypothetical protein